MSRPLRLEFPGAIWHVTSRGNDRGTVFLDDGDRLEFLEVLSRVVAVMRWRLHAYVLMGNHYHLLVETPEPNLSRGMRQLNGVFTQRANLRQGRSGHLFQGRFKGILVERESHLLELCRYLVLNPVRAGLVPTAGDWRWSSYNATASLCPAPEWLETRWTREQFGDDERLAILAFREFVADGAGAEASPWASVKDQIFLGSDSFLERCREEGRDRPAGAEVPRAQRAILRPTLNAVTTEVCREYGLDVNDLARRGTGEARRALAWLARNVGGLGLAEISGVLFVTDWSVSKLEKAGERLREEDAGFRRRLEAMQARLGHQEPATDRDHLA